MRALLPARLGVMALRVFGILLSVAGCSNSTEIAPPGPDSTPDPAMTVTAKPAPVATPPMPSITASAPKSSAPSSTALPSIVPSASSATSHPLEAWMRATASPAFLSGDLASIAAAFDQTAAWAPPGYPHWASISKDGADAARSGNLEAAKAACRECHKQYEQAYRASLSTRPLS